MTLNNRIPRPVNLIALALLVCCSTAASPQGKRVSVKDAIERHTQDYVNGDRIALLDGYSEDIVMVRHGVVIKGKAALAGVIAKIDFASQGPLHVDRLKIDGSLAVEDWTRNARQPNATRGRDIFIVRDGKIAVQIIE